MLPHHHHHQQHHHRHHHHCPSTPSQSQQRPMDVYYIHRDRPHTETIFVSPWSPPTLQFLTYTYYTSTYIYPLNCGRRGFISSSVICLACSTYPLKCGRRGLVSSSVICLACSTYPLKCGRRGLVSSSVIYLACSTYLLKCGRRGLVSSSVTV